MGYREFEPPNRYMEGFVNGARKARDEGVAEIEKILDEVVRVARSALDEWSSPSLQSNTGEIRGKHVP